MGYSVYILASGKNGTLYVGSTKNLARRIHEHTSGIIKGFTSKYSVNKLVYFETADNLQIALKREKQLKKWNRQWKIELIEENNPEWRDLSIGF